MRQDLAEFEDHGQVEQLARGGVAAVNNQARQIRSVAEKQAQQIVHANSARAHERDEIL